MAKILYTDKKLICYVIGKLQNIGIIFWLSVYSRTLLLLFKGFNEIFKIKDPTLEIIHSGQTAVLLGFTCTSITKASSSSRVSDTLKAFKSEHIGDIIIMAIGHGGKSLLS